MPAKPIWKDYEVNVGNVASDSFIISAGVFGNVFVGQANRRPGATDLLVRINDICADWLEHTLPTMQQALLTPTNLPVTFTYYSVTQGATLDTVEFYGDWSYEDGFDYVTQGLVHPINGHIDARQWIPASAIGANDITMVITFKDGTTQSVIIPLSIQADFNADYNADFAISLMTAAGGTAFFDLSQWQDVDYITLNGLATYKVVTDCAEYALCYLNAYGGWDTFLIEGNVLFADALTRHSLDVEYDNASIQARGIRNYAVEMDRQVTMHTGYLSDAESLRMHHLLNSPDVYLWDFAAQTMTPVILTGSTTEYKTYANTGRKMVDYTITARLAKYMARR